MKTSPQNIADAEHDYIVFPDFYIYRNESGWRWVSRDATKSSLAAFDSAPHCALNAERTISHGQVR